MGRGGYHGGYGGDARGRGGVGIKVPHYEGIQQLDAYAWRQSTMYIN